MKLVLVLNGDPPTEDRLRELAEGHPVIAADGGAAVCLRAGVRPLLVAGDFDSLSPESLPADWELRHTPDQTLTDFEKVLECLPDGTDDLLILGGFGRRLDHLITNLLIASALPTGHAVRFEDAEQVLIRVTPDRPFAGEFEPGGLLSLLPLSPVRGVSTSGLRWNLNDADLGAGLGLAQSNRVEGPVRVGIGEGILYVWHPGRTT